MKYTIRERIRVRDPKHILTTTSWSSCNNEIEIPDANVKNWKNVSLSKGTLFYAKIMQLRGCIIVHHLYRAFTLGWGGAQVCIG